MILNKRELVYASLSLFLFLVIYSSTRKEDLVEVNEKELDKKSFDNTKLPKYLKPPVKLMEGEPIPEGAKRNFSKKIQPRFDNWHSSTF
jgi:hypothetical protein